MAGELDPIRLTKEQFAEIPRLEQLIRDYEFELARRKEAGFPTDEQRVDIQKIKAQVNGLKRVYKPL